MKYCLSTVLVLLLLSTSSWALSTKMELGIRGGTDSGDVRESYSAGEVYYLQALPWQKELGRGKSIYTRLDAGVGYLQADSKSGGWLALGGDVVFSLMEGSLELEGGFRPGLFFRDEYGSDDFGGPVQFLSHAGITANLGDVALSYRYTHISNADLYDENAGIDLHLIGLGMRF